MSHTRAFRSSRLLLPLIAACTLFAASPAAAGDEGEACYLHAKMSTTRMVRRTALALIGRVPTLEEYAAVDGKDHDSADVAALVDGWLATDAYRLRMRRYHMELLWATAGGIALRDTGNSLSKLNLGTTQAPSFVWRASGRRKLYRGGDGLHTCQDKDQAQLGYGADGLPSCTAGTDTVGPYCEEGWVSVAPYTDPTTPIHVCAFDAQVAQTYTKTTGDNPGKYSCGDAQSRVKGCGCGPNVRYCLVAEAGIDAMVTDEMDEQLLRLVDDYTQGDAPYREMLTTKKAYTSGRLDYYLEHQAGNAAISRLYNAPHSGDWELEPDWADTAQHAVDRSGPHAGILTLPAYTLRFQTNRGRANRFRIAFLGQYFVPPSNDPTPGCSADAADLTKRCVCLGCHQTLEPMAAFFGPVTEAGAALLTDFSKEAPTLADCKAQRKPGSTAVCDRFYAKLAVPDPEDPSATVDLWRLKPLEFADAHPEYEDNFDAGPAGLVAEDALEKLPGKEYSFLAWSTTKALFAFLMNREMDLDPLSADSDQALLDELALEFEAGDFDFKALVKRIVTSPGFRRMP